jgi:hypothetical protein
MPDLVVILIRVLLLYRLKKLKESGGGNVLSKLLVDFHQNQDVFSSFRVHTIQPLLFDRLPVEPV